MNEKEKLEVLKSLVDVVDVTKDKALTVYLRISEQKILERLYPFNREGKTIPERYALRQCEIAAYLWNKRGAEGEVSHNENGINRTYENADVPASLLKGIIPFAEVL